MNKLLLLVFSFLSYQLCSAEDINVSVNINVNDSVAISKCDLCVCDSLSIAYFSKLTGYKVDFQLPNKGGYTFTISNGPYIISEQEFQIEQDTTLTLRQERKQIILDEVVVTATRQPKTTATGQVFQLSDDAKKSGNPFRALSEIPLLNINISEQTIKTNEGDTPLVLIDGKMVNSGISPIDPKFIESVEITEVVNAKYLQMGVSKILDIRLKRDVLLYTFLDLRTRHDIPLRDGFGGANFEVGTPTFAVSGSVSSNYKHNDKTTDGISETSGNSIRTVNLDNRSRALGYDGNLLFKWVPDNVNYLSGVVRTQMTYDRVKGAGQGFYNTSDYTTQQRSRLDNGGWLGALFYERTLKDNSTITTFAKYNRGKTDEEDSRKDVFMKDGGESENEYLEHERSNRDQYTLSLDYNGADHPFGNISGGNNFEYTHDFSYDFSVNPHDQAKINMASNYSYMSYSNIWKNFFLMSSIGLEYMHINTDSEKNSWWRPRAVASAGLKLPKLQTLRLVYTLDNALPLSSQLATFNNSTNPWLRVQGNPYLVPEEIHVIRLMYDKNLSRFNTRLFAEYNQHRNMIEQYVKAEGEHSIQSYRNNGSWKNITAGSILTFQGNAFRATFKCAYVREKYNSAHSNGILELGGNMRWNFGNFFIYSDIQWQNRSYTAISKTEYKNPSVAHVQIAWQATKNLYLSAALPYFWGVRTEKRMIDQDNYTLVSEKRFKSASLRPWLLISWAIRKNSNQSIRNKMPNF